MAPKRARRDPIVETQPMDVPVAHTHEEEATRERNVVGVLTFYSYLPFM